MPDIADAFDVPNPRLLLVASTGGHIEQLARFYEASSAAADSVFVAAETQQTRSLLNGVQKTFVPDVGPRDYRAAARALPAFKKIVKDGNFDGIVSTGSAIAVPMFLAGRLNGLRTVFIESVSRFKGPSTSGRIVSRLHLATDCWTQHAAWQDSRWRYHGNILGNYHSESADRRDRPLRIFVTLGTWRHHRFDRLVNRLLLVLPENSEVIWQLGATHRDDLPGEVHEYIPTAEFDARAAEADVVISHAGVGSVLRLFELGVFPMLVPRRVDEGEHIDDHQGESCYAFDRLGLALAREAADVQVADLEYCAARKIVPAGHHE